MSTIAKYLQAIREEKNISLEESARRTNTTREIYLQREQEPESVPLFILAKMFNALDMTREELGKFSTLTSQHLRD